MLRVNGMSTLVCVCVRVIKTNWTLCSRKVQYTQQTSKRRSSKIMVHQWNLQRKRLQRRRVKKEKKTAKRHTQKRKREDDNEERKKNNNTSNSKHTHTNTCAHHITSHNQFEFIVFVCVCAWVWLSERASEWISEQQQQQQKNAARANV